MDILIKQIFWEYFGSSYLESIESTKVAKTIPVHPILVVIDTSIKTMQYFVFINIQRLYNSQ